MNRAQMYWLSEHKDRIDFWKAAAVGPRNFLRVAREWGNREGFENTDIQELWFVMGILMGATTNLCDRLDELTGPRT